MTPESALAWVRQVCLAHPGAIEKLSHGSPCFFHEKGKQFAAFVHNHHGDERLALWLPAPPGVQEMLMEANPTAYFRPPYVGPIGWIGVCLDQGVPLEEIERLIDEAYGLTQKKKLTRNG